MGGDNGVSEANGPQIGLVKPTLSEEGELFYNSLLESKEFQWIEGEQAVLLEQVQSSKLVAAIEWNAGDQKNEVVIWKRYQTPELIQLEALVNQRLQERGRWYQYLQVMELNNETSKQLENELNERLNNLSLHFQYEANSNKNGELQAVNQSSTAALGFSIMFLMMNVLSGAGVILVEKNQGTWNRLKMTPISENHLFVGYGLGLFLVGWLQFLILMIVSTILFHVQWGNLLSFIIMTSLFLMSAISLGLFISQITKNFKQQQGIGSLLVVASSMLAGVFWPLEFVPETMQKAALFTPQYWALEGLKAAMFNAATLFELKANILALVGFLATFHLGWLVRRNIKSTA